MVLTLAAEGQARGGMREVDPGRDLGVISGLIAEGFAGDLDSRAQGVLREMRWMARLWPVLGWLMEADPILRESLSGFVWEEPVPGKRGLQIVANVSLNPAPGSRERAVICNVVTRPAYRRQGIARQLTLAALDEARARGAEVAVLQVYSGNLAARRLYTELGFHHVAGELDLRQQALAEVLSTTASGYTVRPWRRSDGGPGLDLARQVTPEPVQWLAPVRQAEYRPDALSSAAKRLSDRIAGRRVHRIVAWKGDRLAGLLTLLATGRGPSHTLRLLVNPDDRGKVEAALVGEALGLLADLPVRRVWATVYEDHGEAVEVLRRVGFEEQRRLQVMTKDLRQ
jgi:ribosomal protein S18 acetylase RimI-like enzyme